MYHFLQSGFQRILPKRCPTCTNGISAEPHPVCSTCWAQLWTSVSPRPLNLSFAWGGTSLLPYHLPHVTHTMRSIKFGNRPDLAVALGRLMAKAIPAPEVDVLVPLPLRADRYYARGYNQAERIAQGLHAVWGLPVATRLIQRPLTVHQPRAGTTRPQQNSLRWRIIPHQPGDSGGDCRHVQSAKPGV